MIVLDIIFTLGFCGMFGAMTLLILMIVWAEFEDTEVGQMIIEHLKKRKEE